MRYVPQVHTNIRYEYVLCFVFLSIFNNQEHAPLRRHAPPPNVATMARAREGRRRRGHPHRRLLLQRRGGGAAGQRKLMHCSRSPPPPPRRIMLMTTYSCYSTHIRQRMTSDKENKHDNKKCCYVYGWRGTGCDNSERTRIY